MANPVSYFIYSTLLRMIRKITAITARFYSSSKGNLIDHFKFRPVIGLELHAQLATRTKLFSASAAFDAPTANSNTNVSAFDSAIPGTLPRLSRSCVEKSILAAHLLNCEVADICRFDRKHYFYPDLPLGYQITQKSNPIAKNGYLDFYAQQPETQTAPFHSTSPQNVYTKRIRIQQIQLEIDSGKTIRDGATDLLDLNRAGLPLIEIVTAPDFDTSTEVACFVEHLRLLLAKNGICTGNIKEGNLRVDVNISVSRGDEMGARIELKNLTNIQLLMASIEKELKRQTEMLGKGQHIQEETRAVDSEGSTISARAKGVQQDYRFLPEPNLPPLAIDPGWLEIAKNNAQLDLPHLVLIQQCGFPPIFAFDILNNQKLCNFMRVYLECGNNPLPFAKLTSWLNELEHICRALSISYPPNDEQMIRHFWELGHLQFDQKLTRFASIDLLKEITRLRIDGVALGLTDLIERDQLWRITDPAWIGQLVDSCIAEQSKDFMAKLLQGNQKSIGLVKRRVVEMSRKRAAVWDINAAIERKIKQLCERKS